MRVVVAHCASIGEDRDLDKGPNGPYVESFALFARVFEKYPNAYGDISAMTQMNRAGPALVRAIESADWHARLLNGSDYPLPGVMPLFSLSALVKMGVLAEANVPAIRELRRANPLLFDFTLKRSLSYRGSRFAAAAFETRDFFTRAS